MRIHRAVLRFIMFVFPLGIVPLLSSLTRSVSPTAVPAAHPLTMMVLSIGCWFGINSPLWYHIGNRHGWHRPPHIQTVYRYMMLWAVMFTLGSIMLLNKSSRQPNLSSSFLFQVYVICLAYGIWHVLANCTFFRVHPSTRLIRHDGVVLGPGESYVIWPFLVDRWTLLHERISFGAFHDSVTSSDRLTRGVVWKPTITVEFDRLDGAVLSGFSYDATMEAVADRLRRHLIDWAHGRPFWDLFDSMVPVCRVESHGLSFVWYGDLSISHEVHRCTCRRSTCQVCNPERMVCGYVR
jgi:hypothetical protein